MDDEITMVQMISELLRTEGHEVFPSSSLNRALENLENEAPDLVIADLYLERTRPVGLDLLARARSLPKPPVVIVITGFGTVETAVEAMRKGAFDYLKKPFQLEDFKLCVRRALSYNQAVTENLYLRRQLNQKYSFDQIVGRSSPMQELFRLVERVADSDSTVLVLGESGTGKELVARALHFNSRRRLSPFVPVNCAALPENLLESELFGHRKGSFTGALNDKQGLFQEAEGGTIFLDEIGSMSPQLQSRLLRVLQDREVRRVGDNTPVYVNVRVIAATNEPLQEKMQTGGFREDLFYRLNVIAIPLPALRAHLDDVPLLVAHFLKTKTHLRTGLPFQVSRAAMSLFCSYAWPGNVRELENAIERACVLADTEVIQPRDLPPQILRGASAVPEAREAPAIVHAPAPAAPLPTTNPCELPESAYPLPGQPAPAPVDAEGVAEAEIGNLRRYLHDQEIAYVNRALAQTGGDKEKAAQLLGISLATLYRKMAGDVSE